MRRKVIFKEVHQHTMLWVNVNMVIRVVAINVAANVLCGGKCGLMCSLVYTFIATSGSLRSPDPE